MDRFLPSRSGRAVALLFVLLAACSEDTGGAVDIEGGAVPTRPGATTVPPGATVLTAELRGGEEVPGPGDADGTGTARLVLTPDGRVCADLALAKIEPATAAHIHSGAKGVDGPVVIPLPTPTDGRATGCAPGDPAAVARVLTDPAAAYVNVHTATQPNGAVRGQLTKT